MRRKKSSVPCLSELTVWGGQGQRRSRSQHSTEPSETEAAHGVQMLFLTAPLLWSPSLPEDWVVQDLGGELIRFSWTEKTGKSEWKRMAIVFFTTLFCRFRTSSPPALLP